MLKRKHKPPKIKMATVLYVLPPEFQTEEQVHAFLQSTFGSIRQEKSGNRSSWWWTVGDVPMDVVVGAIRAPNWRGFCIQIHFDPAERKLEAAKRVVRGFEGVGAKPVTNGLARIEAVVRGDEVPELVRYLHPDDSRCESCGYSLIGISSQVCPECGEKIDRDAGEASPAPPHG